jgi:aryl-alcohol dehydrogenase-like predicted oxidoreductase
MPLIYNQVPYSLIERGIEIELLPQARALGIALGTYRPLCLGLLTGKYRSVKELPPDSRLQRNPLVQPMLARYENALGSFLTLAKDWGFEPAQLATAWVRYSPAVTGPVVGASSVAQLQTALSGFEIGLEAEHYNKISQLFETALYEEWLDSLRRAAARST